MHSWKRNSGKPIADPDKERYANPFKIDKSDIALAASVFLIVDSEDDDDEQDEIGISTV